MTTDIHASEPTRKPVPAYVSLAAWAVPVLTAGDFLVGDVGWYAAIPLAVLGWAAFRQPAVRPLRWWIGASALLFALPFFGSTESDSGQGIMHDMHPLNLALFALTSIVVVAKLWRKQP